MFRSLSIRCVLAVFMGIIVGMAAHSVALADGPNAAADFHIRWAEQAFSAQPAPPGASVPFSFVYGGRRSSELLGKWKRSVAEEPAMAASTAAP